MENMVVDILQCCISHLHRNHEQYVQSDESFKRIGQPNKEKGSCIATDVPRSTVDFSIVPLKSKLRDLHGHSNDFILIYVLLDSGSNPRSIPKC